MSGSLTRPDYGAELADLRRRLGILERRVTPAPTAAEGHAHAGTGTNSLVVDDGTSANAATASDLDTTAVGNQAEATGQNSSAFGFQAAAAGLRGTAIGEASQAADDNTVAVGYGAVAGEPDAMAFGYGIQSLFAGAVGLGRNPTNTHQVNIGTKRIFAGAPNSAPAGGNADLINSQFTVYIDQSLNRLYLMVKYSNGTVKYGTINLV
jgi:hypothetical protein